MAITASRQKLIATCLIAAGVALGARSYRHFTIGDRSRRHFEGFMQAFCHRLTIIIVTIDAAMVIYCARRHAIARSERDTHGTSPMPRRCATTSAPRGKDGQNRLSRSRESTTSREYFIEIMRHRRLSRIARHRDAPRHHPASMRCASQSVAIDDATWLALRHLLWPNNGGRRATQTWLRAIA